MKKFIILLKDKQKGNLTNQLLEEHIAHLKNLKKSNQLILCGPFADNEEAIQIVTAPDFNTAKNIIRKDPFITKKYYRKYEIKELIEANESNNYLMDHSQTTGNITKSNQL